MWYGNKFVTMTWKGLIPIINEDLIASSGFENPGNDNKPERCILIMGLNQSGEIEVAKRERDSNYTYYYYLDTKENVNSKWVYKNYFSAIWDFSKWIVGDNIKWPWCNQPWCNI